MFRSHFGRHGFRRKAGRLIRHGLWQNVKVKFTAFYMFKSCFDRHIQYFKVVLGVTDPSRICHGYVTDLTVTCFTKFDRHGVLTVTGFTNVLLLTYNKVLKIHGELKCL